MTQGKITCSACSHAFAVPPNARAAICPRCGQALPVFFGSIEPTEVPSRKTLKGTSGDKGDSGAQLARIKLKKRPVKKPPPLPKMPPPPQPDPLTAASHPMDEARPDLPPSAPPTIPQMTTDMPEQPGSFVGSPQFSKVPELSAPIDPDEMGELGELGELGEMDTMAADEPTYQMDGVPWMEPGMDEMTGPDLPRRIQGPPIDLAQFAPTTPPPPPAPVVPLPEDRSAPRPRASIVPPPPPPPAPRADLSDFEGDLPGPPVAAVAPVMVSEEPPQHLPDDDIDQRPTHAARPPPLGPPPADPLVHLPTEDEVEATDDDPPPLKRPDSGSYYDVTQSARVAALDAAITDAIEPGPTRAAEPFNLDVDTGSPPGPPQAPPSLQPPPPAAVPRCEPPERLPETQTPYAPAPSSVLPADDYQPLPGVPPARPPTRQLGSQPPPAAAASMLDPTGAAPEHLGGTGIVVLVPDRPIEEVHAGRGRPMAQASEAVEAELLEAPAAPVSPRQTLRRSAAGHGVAMKGAVFRAEHRKSRLTVLLIIAGASVVVGVGGLVGYLVLR